jgi:hypothetical protein
MPIALVVGEHDSGDTIVKAFQDKAFTLGYDLAEQANYSIGPNLLSELANALVMFCVPSGLQRIADLLGLFRPCCGRVIVYAHTARASADEAIRYCHEGLARGYLVMGDGTSEQSIANLAVRLHRGNPPYPPIPIGCHTEGTRPRAFISTPFDWDNRSVMEAAVDLALKKLGFEVEWGDRDYRKTIHDTIRDAIKKSTLLVANISFDGKDVQYNPNVYFEAGMGAAFNLPIIFVRRASEADVLLPADIHGRRWLSYENEIDLALKLYHGLKGKT